MSNKPIAKVVVAAGGKVDKAFDYAFCEDLKLAVGQRVLVPFGRREIEGFVTGFAESSELEPAKIKEIAEVLDDAPIFSPVMLALARWIGESYGTPLGVTLRAIMPAGIGLKNEYVIETLLDFDSHGLKGKQLQIFEYALKHKAVSQREILDYFGKTAQSAVSALVDKGKLKVTHIYEAKDYALRINMAILNNSHPDFEENRAKVMKKGGHQARVLELLANNPSMPVSDIGHLLGMSASPVKSLEQKGLVKIEQTEFLRDVVRDFETSHHEPLKLTPEQAAGLAKLKAALDTKPSSRRPVLIQGVTGSGKTELYIRIIQDVLAQGKQALVLVPEISLTPQTIAAFASRFGTQVTATHSRLSLGERYDQWKKARDGQVSVMVGPRSAIFTPFDNLGVIIIDEEHENTYKSGTNPKFDTGAVAEQLAKLTGALLVMGSATPKLESYYKAREGDYELITLEHRVNNLPIHAEIADMRAELAQGNKSIFSAELYLCLQQTLEEGGQAILFINRRGHSTFVSCRSCGHVCSCPNCSVNYTYHRQNAKLICHYCNDVAKNPKNCPTCGSTYIKYFGIGTQKIEEYLAQEFPLAKVLRMDLDTTGKKNSHHNIIKDFADGKANILVGTQMIAKGLNFPSVNLVGIVAADIALNSGDFRAAETAYQLITQVAGRAGRGIKAGRVIIQTYNPEHYSIKYAVQDNYTDFYNHEIEIRRQMNYPPYTHIFQILFTGESEKQLILALNTLVAIMKQANRKNLCEMLGPAPAQVVKIKENYRWKVLVKCNDSDILQKFVHYCMDKLEKIENLDGVKINLTPNPAYIN
ncbi:MAG: primosomal protein N' [Defluviitaleaceae bacterium]|nr:primosomal protein N' [Defluviitaleaceae bacterium]